MSETITNMSTPKFSFVPERQIGQVSNEGGYSVSIFKSGVLCFSINTLRIYELEGKYIRLFADVEKKAIGWSVVEGKTNLDDINDSRLVKTNASGCAVLGITKLLKKIGIEKETSFFNLPVKVYKSPLNSYDIYYIELKKVVEPKP